MEKTYPDKYIRKALFDVLDGITVNSQTINCYDTRVTGIDPEDVNNYILITTQTSQEFDFNKCEDLWDSSVLLDIVTSYKRQGNPGSRVLVDDIVDNVRSLTNNLTLGGGLTVIEQRFVMPNSFTDTTANEIIQRKLVRLELKIK